MTAKTTPAWPQRQWILTLLFALGALGAWWQLRLIEAPNAPETPRHQEPDAVVLNFSALETHADGTPSRRLSATELRQYFAAERSEFEQPRLELYPEDGPPWRARARQGRAIEEGARVDLEGAVELEREASASTPATHIQTERLTIRHAESYAETDAAVRIASGADWLQASGMQLWYGEPARATFQGRAQLLLSAPSEPTP
ncbi:MAG: LPS export ABC transporter periplasmic protein LptC [Chromatiaceae bacterium]|nr:LPS export ABC transporter periplasmic protein LptC [Chromatiaceae bacterium]